MWKPTTIVLIAIAFEGALGLAGLVLAAWFDVPLASRLNWANSTGDVAVRSALLSVPMLLLLAFAMGSTWQPIAELRHQVTRLIGELFHDVAWPGLAAVSLAAGLGEEILFRGAIQPVAERLLGGVEGLMVASLLFGAAHAVSPMYFLFATAVGLYLGFFASGFDDLLTPIITHAVYDFVALVLLQSSARRQQIRP
jgi:uncharacterized protein